MHNKAVVSIRRFVYVWSCVLVLGLIAFPAEGQERTGGSESGSVTGTGPRPDDDGIYTLEDGVTTPQILKHTFPSYTDEAIRAKVQGFVLFQVVIRKSGRVDSFKVLSGPGYGLEEKTIQEIASNWRFRPATVDGKPVDLQTTLEVTFNLDTGNKVKEDYGWTALMGAAQNGQTSKVQALLDAGAKVKEKDDNSGTALIYAAQGGHAETVQILLDAGAKVKEKNNRGITAIIFAALQGHKDTVEVLLNAGADVNAKTNGGYTALWAAAQESHTEIVELLKKAGAKE